MIFNYLKAYFENIYLLTSFLSIFNYINTLSQYSVIIIVMSISIGNNVKLYNTYVGEQFPTVVKIP